MKRKVLLIQPPIRDFYCTPQRTQPLGLEYIASALERNGWCSQILDCAAFRRPKPAEMPDSMDYLKNVYKPDDQSPIALFRRFQHFGMGFEEIKTRVVESQADVVGISALFVPYQSEALEVARIVKDALPKAVVVLGGGFPTCQPQEALQHKPVDYVVAGEGEEPFVQLLTELQKGNRFPLVSGVGFRNETGEIKLTAPVQQMGFPQRSMKFVSKTVQVGKQRWVSLQTSRGCPHHCRFCSAKLMVPGLFRQRDVMEVIQEMQALQSLISTVGFNFEDDNLTADRVWTLRFCDEIKRYFGVRKIRLAAMNGLCPADLDMERLAALHEAGFDKLDLSLAVHDQSLQRDTQRPVPTNRFISIAEAATDLGMQVTAYVILGMPGQTVQRMARTIRMLAGLPVFIGPSIYYPTPGTEVFEQCKRNGLIESNHPELWRSTCAVVETKEFNRLDIFTFMRSVRLINFLKANADMKALRMLTRTSGRGGFEANLFEVGSNKGETGLWLIGEILRERSFFSVHLPGQHQVTIEELPTSRRVFDAVFEGKGLEWICPAKPIHSRF